MNSGTFNHTTISILTYDYSQSRIEAGQNLKENTSNRMNISNPDFLERQGFFQPKQKFTEYDKGVYETMRETMRQLLVPLTVL